MHSYLGKMPLRDRKAVSLDIATGGGKSYVMYGLAAIALAEGLVDRVLVLCPSVTIEEGLLDKFSTLAGENELAEIMKELGASVIIPAIKRGNQTVQNGDICIENIHAVYENAGSSIADSFCGRGERTLVLNDEAHHLFSPPEKGLKQWMSFLQNKDYGFRYVVNVTGTPYLGSENSEYFPDVVFRYGLKKAIEDKIVKKPDYKLEETYTDSNWQKTYAFHRENQDTYGKKTKPITIIVTQEIWRCVEVWNELIQFLAEKEDISREDAERKAIWVTSGVPSGGAARERIEAAYGARGKKDSPEKRRKENLDLLKNVDEGQNLVEWIVSVSMLTEGWDVKNVFQIVPHDSRAFSSKLLIQQVLGRGLRVPPGFDTQPLVRVNNHEKWSPIIGNLLNEILEIENTLSWGYDPRRAKFVFPLHNLRYEPEQIAVEVKREKAHAPDLAFHPQDRKTTEHSTFSESGTVHVEIEHKDILDIEDAVKLMRLFLREKDETVAKKWTKQRLRDFIVDNLKKAGQDATFISKGNLQLLQQGFGPVFRGLDEEHPRMTQTAKGIVTVNVSEMPRQSFSESMLKQHGAVYYVNDAEPPFNGPEANLWEHYQKLRKQYSEYGEDAAEQAKEIATRLHVIDHDAFKMPWNVHYASFEPERKFSDILFHEADLFDAFMKMPDQGGYSFPYSYKPAKAARTHVLNENFNPDFFLLVHGKHDILVIEVKSEGDDSNRNRAKSRDGLEHFKNLNSRLEEIGELWRYHFYFLSPENFTNFFEQVQNGTYAGWKSGLMQELLNS